MTDPRSPHAAAAVSRRPGPVAVPAVPAVQAVVAVLAAVASLLVLASPARAETVFTGDLDGPTAGTDSPATGTARLVLDEQQRLVTYEVTYSNLQGEEFEAHFHAGAPGSFGPPVHHLPLGTPKTGTWEVTQRQATSLMDGQISVMIHTDLFPEGEIGGWVEAETASVDRATWEAVKRLFQ